MNKSSEILIDPFGRKHTYLRIALTERCNLRCTYCMPSDGLQLSPKSHLMTYEEIFEIAKQFVDYGVTKIRLTGGEPFIRKDVATIIEQLATLPIELSITTNGVIIDKFIPLLKRNKIKHINLSLDSLDEVKNNSITGRSFFQRVYNNLLLLVKEKFVVKLNCVLIKGVNDDEIINFIELTQSLPIHLRFIEFMPFDGNKWNIDKLFPLKEILDVTQKFYKAENLQRLIDPPHGTAKNYAVKGYRGTFAIISSITNPFCDACNRIRLMANGSIKNCLFSSTDVDLLGLLRAGKSILPAVQNAIRLKKEMRSGINTLEQFKHADALHNRSMIFIGG